VQKDVDEFCDLSKPARKLPPADENLCNDFNADTQLKRTDVKYDFTGICHTPRFKSLTLNPILWKRSK
jgi:hypothetical protein